MREALVGRARELAALDAALTRAAEGTAGVLVVGEPGIGKSALLRAFLERSRTHGALVLTGSGLPTGGRDLAFAVAAQVLLGLRRENPSALDGVLNPATAAVLADLVPDLAPPAAGGTTAPAVGPEEGELPGLRRSRLLATLAAIVERLAATQPVVLAVDDAQWVDGSTLALLETLLRGSPPRGLLLALTARHLEMPPAVRRWLDAEQSAGRLTVVSPHPLTQGETVSMLSALGPEEEARARAAEVHRLSGGNPLLIRELGTTGTDILPSSIRETVTTRLASLGTEGRRTVGAVAVAGRAVSHQVLVHVLDVPTVTGGVPEGLRSGLLMVERDSYRISHELVRVAVVDALMPADRLAHHTSLAWCLARSAPENVDAAAAGEIAWHFERCGNLQQTAVWARRSADEAERIGAFAAAHAQLVRLLNAREALGGLDADERISLLQRAAVAAEHSSHHEEALAHVDEALALVEPLSRRDSASVLHGQRSFVLLQLGRIPEATGAAEAAVRWAESERTQALALCRVALLLNYTGRLDEARQLAQRALDVAQATDDRALQVRARLALSDAEPLVGPHERSLSLLTQAWRGAVGLGDSELIGMVGASMSDALQVSGRLQESVVFAREAIDALRGVAEGTHWLEGLLACNAVEALLALGHWNDAAVLLDEVAPRDRYGFTRLGRAQLRVARGELEAAERDLEAVRHLQNRDSASAGLSFDEVLVKLRLWQNRPAEALAEVRDLIDVLEPGPLLERGRLLCVLGLRAAAELAADGRAWGSPARVAEALADGRRLAQVAEEILGHDEVLRRMAAAEVSRLENRPAPHAWALAVEACGSENPDLCAYARWRQAEALLETSGARTEAKSLLRNAADIAHRLGARRLESEIEALAARARIDLSEGTDAAPPAVLPAAPAGLTPREVEVLRLVGRGHTNREIARTLFMSESTASVHVTHILSKLDLSNRVQAATVAVRLGLVHDDPGQTRR